MNHEYINPTFLHPKGPTKPNGRRPEDEVIREVNAHGVSGTFSIRKSRQIRKLKLCKIIFSIVHIQATTIMDFNRPVAGNPLLRNTIFTCGSQNSRHTQQLW